MPSGSTVVDPRATVREVVDVIRVFKAYLRRIPADANAVDRQAALAVRTRIRQAAAWASAFANQLATDAYLAFRLGQELPSELTAERAERYRAYGDRLSAAVRDSIKQRVVGAIRRLGRDVMAGKVSLPVFRRDGALVIRETGVRLWRDAGRLYCSLRIDTGPPIVCELWVKNLRKSPRYQAILERLLDGTYPIRQAQVLLDGKELSVAFAYRAPTPQQRGVRQARVEIGEEQLLLTCGPRVAAFAHEIRRLTAVKRHLEARMRKARQEASQIQAGKGRPYRYRMLRRFRRKWYHAKRDWHLRLAVGIVKQALAWGCSAIALPTSRRLAESFVQDLDWSGLATTLKAKAEEAGLKVLLLRGLEEQEAQAQAEHVMGSTRERMGRIPSVGMMGPADDWNHEPADV